ncbi:GNAT family N-acetyltransferase [Mucilaginibacter rubeus]|uniref:GNAT family N-acetyltransferase n=1 Tax=Mucilaginibacter rubeus TaxID=2027860 RepID=A0AAE6JL75_9SPHI|nr:MULTISPECIES: GNAT family N-acetyltransferase [Mucilaginibacter]QEM07799.1 GNAT family N-acetyltransferase [Mucilaginibacter rubeus]QEM20251.1 GNAT family N-acetyltransferase [Mucilaginibacter gossypii]QTE43031.1 GNAT family N-acetyltransferase [Mucilaginibacter rubeus]QTE49632.1 GNAT family N-acetyltransferase [Mucilaginibacter rubeus]QTE54727.1 GNAT family N-acetyltransferase [Mucilaginibacter rubeus]
MIEAIFEDRAHIISLLAKAFKDNQSVNYIVREDNDKAAHIQALMEYSFDMCFHYGEIYLSDDKSACALLLPPKCKRTDMRSVWLDIKLVFNAIGVSRIGIALKRENAIKEKQLKGNIQYLWFIGVDTTLQHRGIGSNLLNEILEKSDLEGMPVCLETSTLKNLPWYEKFGFEVYDKLNLGYQLYFLQRKPRSL